MRTLITIVLWLLCASVHVVAKQDTVELRSYNEQHALVVNGEKLFIKGMNWDYYPTGTNYTYSLWNQPEATIVAALD